MAPTEGSQLDERRFKDDVPRDQLIEFDGVPPSVWVVALVFAKPEVSRTVCGSLMREPVLSSGHRAWAVGCGRFAVAAVAALVLTGCAANFECNGHPCVGSWKRDMALGGSVVQCGDGKWSHAGGLDNACSGHGGEPRARRTKP